MAFLEAANGIGTRLLSLRGGWLSDSSTTREGMAWLTLAEGRRIPVSATLTMRRTFFSVTGGGFFLCEEGNTFRAILNSQWLELDFDDATRLGISVYKVRSSDAKLHCWFEVHS